MSKKKELARRKPLEVSPAILILGEGETEFYYLQSLRDNYPQFRNIKPASPKHTNMKALGTAIEDAIKEGYDKIFCLIDMDTKGNKSENRKYEELKSKYSKPIKRKGNPIVCEVRFFETHPCTELFFLYYFLYTSKVLQTGNQVEQELNNALKSANPKSLGYEKTIEFFRKRPLHRFFTASGGTLKQAIEHAEKSCTDGRDYTYSELGKMFLALGIKE